MPIETEVAPWVLGQKCNPRLNRAEKPKMGHFAKERDASSYIYSCRPILQKLRKAGVQQSILNAATLRAKLSL